MDSTREQAWLDYACRGIAHRDRLAGIERGAPARPEFRAANSGDSEAGLVLFGHAAVTGEWTDLADFLGPYREQVASGAFKKTLKERGVPVVQFNHGRDPAVGTKPIGLATVAHEDDRGLYIEADLFDAEYVRELIPALRSGAISGMSFMFDVVRESWTWASDSESGMDERTIEEVRLYEAGPVVWPAYEQTDVGIRSAIASEVLDGLDVKARRDLAQICRTSPAVAARLAAPTRGHQPDTAARDAAARERHLTLSKTHSRRP